MKLNDYVTSKYHYEIFLQDHVYHNHLFIYLFLFIHLFIHLFIIYKIIHLSMRSRSNNINFLNFEINETNKKKDFIYQMDRVQSRKKIGNHNKKYEYN